MNDKKHIDRLFLSQKNRSTLIRWTAGVLFTLATTLQSSAQSSASLTGIVSDANGAVVQGAHITCRNIATSLTYKIDTNQNGSYSFADLPVGTYEITVEREGFGPASFQGVQLATAQNVSLPVKLTLGTATQAVDVTDRPQEVQPTSSELTTSIQQKSMQDLPLNGRNALQLVFLVPGTVTQNDSPSFQSANTRISVNGNRGTDNAYMLDGVQFTDTHYGTAPILPSPDALQEFTVKTSNFTAQEQGAGANVQFTTRSGTNQLHGSVFEYLRNDAMDARNYFSTQHIPFKRNQFGGTLGGPILHDRTFFFLSYQGTRQRGGASPANAVVPTPEQAQGVFGTRTVAIDPTIAKLLPYIPTSTTGNLYFAPRTDSNDDQALVRVDHQLTSKNRLTARYFYDDYSFQEQTSPITAFYGLDRFLNRNLLVSDTHTFSSNLLFTAAFGFTNLARERDAEMPVTAQSIGANVPLATLAAPPQINIAITGYSGLVSGTPIIIVPKTYNYRGHLIWIHGAHQIEAGIDVLRNREYAFDRSGQSGTWSFDGSRTGINNAFADFLQGLPISFTQKGTSPQNIYETKIAPFVQDDWKVTRKLTLNLGIRWEPWLPAVDQEAPQVGFVPGVQSTVAPNAPTGMVFSGDAGMPHAIFRRDMNNFAPRVGFAYDVTGTATTVIRGSYGIFYRPMPLNLQRFSGNTAAFRTLSVQIPTPASFENPYASLSGGTPFPWTVPNQSDLASYTFNQPVTTSGLVPSSRTSYVHEYTLTIEHQLHNGIGLSATYVGNHMLKGMSSTEGNPGVYSAGATTSNINSRRLYKGLASVQLVSDFQMSNYNALQLTANKHSNLGLTLIGNYTWSKCMDNNSSSQGTVTVINKFNISKDYARCDYDVEQSGTVSVVYDLPNYKEGNRLIRTATNGWQLTTITSISKGLPFNVYSGTDRALSGTTTNSGTNDLTDQVIGISRNRPAGVSQLKQWFNTAAFAPAALGTFGNSGRNSLFQPGLWNVDFGLLKNFTLTGRTHLTLRGEAFNLFNHANFSGPTATYTSANFGKITSARDPRVVQVSGRITF